MTAPRNTDEVIPFLLSILKDPQWSVETLEDVPQETPFGELCRELVEIREHVQALSRGELDRGNRGHGFVAGSLKATEANLRHLTWQMERVASGDYSQSVAFMGEFSNAFNRMSREIHSRSEELSRLLEQYRLSTDRDILTGLLNRRTFVDRAVGELHRAREAGTPLCLTLADIDSFKKINDHFGHANGDRVLQLFACRLKENAHPEDLCCRFGGDEFLVLMPNTDKEEGLRRLDRLWRACSLNTESGVQVTASFGVAFIDVSTLRTTSLAIATLEHAIQEASNLLMQAKREGKNRICSREQREGECTH